MALARFRSTIVSPIMQAYGFGLKRGVFRRYVDGNLAMIDVQGSNESNTSSMKVTVNLGLLHARLYRHLMRGRKLDDDAMAQRWHIEMRIGSILPGRDDDWWPIPLTSAGDARTENEQVSGFLHVLETVAIPFVMELTQGDHFYGHLKSGGFGMPKVEVAEYLAPFAVWHGDVAAMEQVVSMYREVVDKDRRAGRGPLASTLRRLRDAEEQLKAMSE